MHKSNFFLMTTSSQMHSMLLLAKTIEDRIQKIKSNTTCTSTGKIVSQANPIQLNCKHSHKRKQTLKSQVNIKNATAHTQLTMVKRRQTHTTSWSCNKRCTSRSKNTYFWRKWTENRTKQEWEWGNMGLLGLLSHFTRRRNFARDCLQKSHWGRYSLLLHRAI